MEKHIIFDVSAVLFPVMYSDKLLLETKDQIPTEHIYTLLSKVHDLYFKFGCTKFSFCFEGNHNKRKEIDPTYKCNRNKKLSDEMKMKFGRLNQQIKILLEILPEIGFSNVFKEVGYESDDVIASIVQNNTKNDFIIYTSDHDLKQLLAPNVKILQPMKNTLYTEQSFALEYPALKAKDYWKLLSISGCRTDNVKGIKGIAGLSAYRYLTKQLDPSSLYYQRIRANMDTIKHSARLVRLPLEGCPKCVLKKDKLKWDKFVDVCNRYELYSFIKGIDVGIKHLF